MQRFDPARRLHKDSTPLPAIGSLPLGATLPGASRRKAFWNSLSRDHSIAELRSVPAFLPGRASVGPRSFGKVADGRQGSAKSSNDSIGVPLSTGKVTDNRQTYAEGGFPRLLDPAEGLTDNSRGNCR